jgi:hypothetical protein
VLEFTSKSFAKIEISKKIYLPDIKQNCSVKHIAFLLSVGKMEDEVSPKKLPSLRKANISPLNEQIPQREVENINFDEVL